VEDGLIFSVGFTIGEIGPEGLFTSPTGAGKEDGLDILAAGGKAGSLFLTGEGTPEVGRSWIFLAACLSTPSSQDLFFVMLILLFNAKMGVKTAVSTGDSTADCITS